MFQDMHRITPFLPMSSLRHGSRPTSRITRAQHNVHERPSEEASAHRTLQDVRVIIVVSTCLCPAIVIEHEVQSAPEERLVNDCKHRSASTVNSASPHLVTRT